MAVVQKGKVTPWCTKHARKNSAEGFFAMKKTARGVNLDMMVDSTGRVLLQKIQCRRGEVLSSPWNST
jgi:hypothetical protein